MRPSLRAILWNDWPALAGWIGIVVVWLFHLGLSLLQGAAADLPLLLPVLASAALSVILAWRVSRIQRLFVRGIEVHGEVTSVHLVRDRGRLDFSYLVDGAPARSWIPVHKTKRVMAFRIGQAVRVLVDPARPSRAIVKELFSDGRE